MDEEIIDNKIRICKHICEKKKRQCKFNALKNTDYCVQHLAFHDQTKNAEKRVVCPLDPKHSVYEKNFEKHLKKCNSVIKTLGTFDVKNVNVLDDEPSTMKDCDLYYSDLNQNLLLSDSDLESLKSKTYKELTVEQLIKVVDMVYNLDKEFKLHDLEFNELENEFIENELNSKNDYHKKHLKQISSIVSHVDNLSVWQNKEVKSLSMVELGAGRGKLSYWLNESRKAKVNNNELNAKLNILLIERGAQRYKFDTQLKVNDAVSSFERIRIDLKDLYLSQVPMIKESDKFILYGKHLCGVATDYAIRCMKKSLEETGDKFSGFILAVCCHHQCEWESFCGKEFLEKLKFNSNLFYIVRSLTSWLTCGEREHANEEFLKTFDKLRIGRICKNLFDYARLQYIKKNFGSTKSLKAKLFYYTKTDVTLENTMIHVSLD